ncbi:MAG TPA: preprotein translocase subunit YajC [Caproiciproducens sp.]|nr:preprotein translocase subunit YajC [Caproiciproducens sp.]
MNLYTLTADATGGGSMWTIILIYALVIGALYFFLMRPQQKKKKKEEQMRKNVQIGDEITTIGGIVGRVVGIKEEADSIIIETGADRAKLKIKRWAVGSVDTIHDDAE